MTLKQLMGIKNGKVLVKMLSYEGADEMLRVHLRHLGNETSVLRKSYNEAVFILKNGQNTLNLDYAEVELDDLHATLKEKLHQLNHVNSLLDDLRQQQECLEC